MRRLGKAVYSQGYRGFKSLPLRQINSPHFAGYLFGWVDLNASASGAQPPVALRPWEQGFLGKSMFDLPERSNPSLANNIYKSILVIMENLDEITEWQTFIPEGKTVEEVVSDALAILHEKRLFDQPHMRPSTPKEITRLPWYNPRMSGRE